MQRVRSRRGLAVVLVICSLAALFGLASSILVLAGGGLNLSITHQQSEQARFAAEAGIAWGVDECSLHGALPTNPCSHAMENEGQSFIVTTYDNRSAETPGNSFPGGPQVPPHTLYIVSEGLFRGAHSQKQGCLVHQADGPFQVGALAPYYWLPPGSSLDAYDSRLGFYEDTASRVHNTNLLATNENSRHPHPHESYLDANFDTEGDGIAVDGKVFVGPSGNVDEQIHPKVHANGTGHLPATLPVPGITLPVGLTDYPPVHATGSGVVPLPPGHYTKVEALNGAVIQLEDRGNYIIDELWVKHGQIAIDQGPCNVYVTNVFSARTADAVVNNSKLAKNLNFYYTQAEDVTGASENDRAYIAGGAKAFFTLLVPNTWIDVADGSTIYGSLISGKSIQFSGVGHFHYDVSLAAQAGGSGNLAIINRHSL